jgi:hypothetical protein
MTLDEYLKQVSERSRRSTQGPCEVVRFDNGNGSISYQVESGFGKNHVILGNHDDLDNPNARADAEFEAKVREDIPKLLKIISVMREALEKIEVIKFDIDNYIGLLEKDQPSGAFLAHGERNLILRIDKILNSISTEALLKAEEICR